MLIMVEWQFLLQLIINLAYRVLNTDIALYEPYKRLKPVYQVL